MKDGVGMGARITAFDSVIKAGHQCAGTQASSPLTQSVNCWPVGKPALTPALSLWERAGVRAGTNHKAMLAQSIPAADGPNQPSALAQQFGQTKGKFP